MILRLALACTLACATPALARAYHHPHAKLPEGGFRPFHGVHTSSHRGGLDPYPHRQRAKIGYGIYGGRSGGPRDRL